MEERNKTRQSSWSKVITQKQNTIKFVRGKFIIPYVISYHVIEKEADKIERIK
jgi:hypothetical protein